METVEIMGRVVDLIVSKAQMEEHFCFMYADLCKKITEKWVSEEINEEQQQNETAQTENTTSTGGAPDLGKSFRVRLLERCQEEFQQDREAAMQAVRDLQIPDEDKEEKLFILKRRYTGHMRFIGEIYMKELLKPTKVYMCIEDLLQTRDDEKLSCLCKLLQTVGKKLESYDVKKKKGKFVEYFQQINELSTDKSLSTKVRFGFRDLIEMRKNNWTARRVEEKAKKLSELREGQTGTPTGQGQGGNNASQGQNQGHGIGQNQQYKSSTPRTVGAQDARAMTLGASTSSSSLVDEWNVVPAGKVKKGGPPPKGVTPGRGGSSTKPSSVNNSNSNQFSALSAATTQRSGGSTGSTGSGKGKSKSRDDDDIKRSNHPHLSIPQSASFSSFSPMGESPAPGDMSPLTRENSGITSAPGADGFLDEAMTVRVRILFY